MEQKEFIEVSLGGMGNNKMISISSISLIEPAGNDCSILLKQNNADGVGIVIKVKMNYQAVKALIQNYQTRL